MSASPDTLAKLIDDHDRYTAVAFIGGVLIAISGIIMGLAQQDLLNGTHFLSALGTVEGGVGSMILGYGLLRRHMTEKELEASEPKGSAKAAAH